MRSLLRILIASALVIAVLFVIAAVLVRQPLYARVKAVPARADAARLRAHVDFLTTTTPARNADHPERLLAAAQYIAGLFRESGAVVEEQDYEASGRTYRNVIGHYGPRNGQVLIIGAHYDAFGAGADLPGADDNASGTAGLLELARLLGRAQITKPVTLVAFSTEEPPFFASEHMGSAVHAASLAHSGRPVAGMICLEMIGYYADEQQWEPKLLSLLYPKHGDFIGVAGGWRDRKLARQVKAALNAAGANAVSFTGPRSLLDASDQRNYWARGWPAVIITDTAYLRNPNYHMAGDTADTLDYTRMARIVEGLLTAIVRLRD